MSKEKLHGCQLKPPRAVQLSGMEGRQEIYYSVCNWPGGRRGRSTNRVLSKDSDEITTLLMNENPGNSDTIQITGDIIKSLKMYSIIAIAGAFLGAQL